MDENTDVLSEVMVIKQDKMISTSLFLSCLTPFGLIVVFLLFRFGGTDPEIATFSDLG